MRPINADSEYITGSMTRKAVDDSVESLTSGVDDSDIFQSLFKFGSFALSVLYLTLNWQFYI